MPSKLAPLPQIQVDADAAWRWSAHTPPFQGVSSPPLVPCLPEPLLEYATFLPQLTNFSLEDDVSGRTPPRMPEASYSANADEATGTVALVSPTRATGTCELSGFPLCRQHSHELADIVQSAFDEMDNTLSARPPAPASSGTLNAGAPEFQPRQLCTPPEGIYTPTDGMDLEPTEDEQAWLDEQCDAMEQTARMEAEEEVLMDAQAAEQEWIRQLLLQHPHLGVDEARHLYGMDYPSSPEDS